MSLTKEPKIKSYIVIETNTVLDLEKRVKILLDTGWLPQGGVSFHRDAVSYFHQAMILKG